MSTTWDLACAGTAFPVTTELFVCLAQLGGTNPDAPVWITWEWLSVDPTAPHNWQTMGVSSQAGGGEDLGGGWRAHGGIGGLLVPGTYSCTVAVEGQPVAAAQFQVLRPNSLEEEEQVRTSRLVRLMAHIDQYPHFLGRALAHYAAAHGRTEEALAAELGVREWVLDHLRLCAQPDARDNSFPAKMAAIAQLYGCDEVALLSIVREGVVLAGPRLELGDNAPRS